MGIRESELQSDSADRERDPYFRAGSVQEPQTRTLTIADKTSGGWDPSDPNIKLAGPSLREEIEQGFKNVEMVLRNAGAQGWEDVYKMHSYHAKWEGDVAGGSVEEGPTKIMADMLQKYGKGVKPVWTEIGVARLGLEAMRIEIEVEAYVKN